MIRSFAAIAFLALGLCVTGYAQEQSQKSVQKSAVSYGLVVDNSGSYRTLIDRVVSVVSDVVEENGPDDEAFLVTFVDTPKIVLRQEFTDRKSELHDAAQNMFIEGGYTAIIDAVKSSADYLAGNARSEPGRSRALVLVTDGEDRESQTKLEDVLKILKDNDIRVFVIAMAESKVTMKVIERLTKATGGAIVAPKARGDLTAAAKQVSAAMRTK